MSIFLAYIVLLIILLTGISNLIIGFLGIPIQWFQFSRDTGNILGSGLFWLTIFYIWNKVYKYSMPLLAMILIGIVYYGVYINTQKRKMVPGVDNDLMGQTAGFFIFSIGYLLYHGIRYSQFNWI